MKQIIFTAFFILFTVLSLTAQIPAYEYVPYKSGDRNATVQLPEFTVALKKDYLNENTAYPQVQKIFVVSDIEGEYERFKKLLQAAGVMDAHFNWTFGDGHLVITGDVFDRGNQVTECLWLIYLLEEKSKLAGGYVHFVLGNHEIMNLTNDLRYLNPKYLDLAKQKGIAYNAFYSEETELGLWLRTKNIMEKIGDHLFVHGGISQQVNEAGQQLDSINSVARRYYDSLEDSIPALAQLLLMDDGPLWYRGYFKKPAATAQQIDSTLQLYNVAKIIIGHSLVEKITAFYNGKIIDTDVAHAKGKSEGLLIENKYYYRINQHGDKVILTQ